MPREKADGDHRAEKGRLAGKASQRPEEEKENAGREPLLVRVAAS